MDIRIRQEQPADYRETEHVMREAFWNHYSPGCTEHYLLHVMRRSPHFIPELDFVAVADGQIIGSVVFLKSYILGDDGQRYDVLSLGPIAVLPAFQRKGVGRMLIEHARNAAAAMGYRAILLCGDPLYYTKVGFTAAEQFGIRTSENKYMVALHACPLYADALKTAAGRYFEDEIYNVDEAAATAFDAQFPPKERIVGTPTQRRFEEVVAMQKDYIGKVLLVLVAFACLLGASCTNKRQAYLPQAKLDTIIARSTTNSSPDDAVTISNLPGQDETNFFLSPERIWTEAYDLVEEMPQFPGGNEALRNYLATKLRYPPSAAEKGIEGKVIVRFIVLPDGHIGPVRVDDSTLQADPDLEKEAVRLIAGMPRWTPGRQQGKEVAVKCVIPVEFKQSKKDTTRYYIPECFLVDVQDFFEEREDTSVVMWAEHPVYGTDVQAVNVFVENPTHTSLTYGRDWYLYQWNGKEWVLAKIKGPYRIAWPDDGFNNQRAPAWYCFRFPIGSYYHLSKGKYRIYKSFYAGRQEIALHAEFEIK